MVTAQLLEAQIGAYVSGMLVEAADIEAVTGQIARHKLWIRMLQRGIGSPSTDGSDCTRKARSMRLVTSRRCARFR